MYMLAQVQRKHLGKFSSKLRLLVRHQSALISPGFATRLWKASQVFVSHHLPKRYVKQSFACTVIATGVSALELGRAYMRLMNFPWSRPITACSLHGVGLD